MTDPFAWFEFVRVGDVLQAGQHGAYRVVRSVTRWTCGPRRGQCTRDIGPLRSVTFTIRHGSWTGRCYTVLTASDLKTRCFRYVGVRMKLTSDFDAKIAAAIHNDEWQPYSLTAKDVRGVA